MLKTKIQPCSFIKDMLSYFQKALLEIELSRISGLLITDNVPSPNITRSIVVWLPLCVQVGLWHRDVSADRVAISSGCQ